ncbi:MAG: (Fe-S)-binding protein [Armatimonadetes bacterium]|nr:(Fe-S)-binding protein [Armatimonadota bacterium]
MLPDQAFIENELSRCNKCGYCMQSCPVYRAERREANVARGRNRLLRAVLEGERELSREMREPFFDCLLCGACTNDCFGKVRTKDLMVRAREAYAEDFGSPLLRRYLFHNLLPAPQRLTPLMRLASLGKRTGLARLAERMGLLRWLSPNLEVADALVPTMPKAFLRDRLAGMGFRAVPHAAGTLYRWEPDHATGLRVLYFIGCGTNYQLPRSGEAALRLLHLGGCQITVAPNNCCGLPPWSYGDTEAARLLARRNVELLSDLDCDAIVTECGSCSGFLKEYGEVLGEVSPDGPDGASSAAPLQSVARGPGGELSSRVRDFTEVLATLSLPRPVATGTPLTYHDPCHLGRSQGVREQPRKLLVDVGGYELREMAEADRCCGGAGSYNITHPELSRAILGRKLDNAGATGAQLIATACPACILQLGWGGRERGEGFTVRHVAELLAERQGLELGP